MRQNFRAHCPWRSLLHQALRDLKLDKKTDRFLKMRAKVKICFIYIKKLGKLKMRPNYRIYVCPLKEPIDCIGDQPKCKGLRNLKLNKITDRFSKNARKSENVLYLIFKYKETRWKLKCIRIFESILVPQRSLWINAKHQGWRDLKLDTIADRFSKNARKTENMRN